MLQLKHYSQWQQVRPLLDELCADAPSYFLTLDWFDNFIQNALDQKQQLLIITLQEGDRLVGLLPLTFECQECKWLRPIRYNSLSNYYTSFFMPIMAEGYEERCVQHWARWLGVKADVIYLSPMRADHPYMAFLIAIFASHGWQVNPYFLYGNWYAPAIRDFDSYWQERPSKLRNTVRRQIKKIQNQHALAFELITDKTDLSSALLDYQRLYRLRWQCDEPYPHFIEGLIKRLIKNGRLRLGLLRLDEQVVAAQLWFVYKGTGYIFKLAYDPAFGHFSVGSILTYYLAKHLIEQDAVHTLDFLTGDDMYKRDWMTHRAECQGLQIVNLRTSVGQMLAARNVVARLLKRLWRRLMV